MFFDRKKCLQDIGDELSSFKFIQEFVFFKTDTFAGRQDDDLQILRDLIDAQSVEMCFSIDLIVQGILLV